MHIVAGLGNPGEKFKGTLHNSGFRVLEKLKKGEGWQKSGSGNYLFVKTRLEEKNVLLVKPLTFMNRSGEALLEAKKKEKVENKNIILVHDDFAIKTGRVKISKGRGAAGHKGVGSVIEKVGKDFIRVRVGTGTEKKGFSLKRLVLKKPKRKQKEILVKGEETAKRAVLAILKEGVDKAMNEFNKQKSGF